MKNLLDYTLEELQDDFVNLGYKKFNARQVFEWIYKKRIFDFSQMSNLNKSLRSFLNDNYTILNLEVVTHQVSFS
jgi:23S rRNA (adenine2503-C2)-methyltransferase